MIGFLVPGRVRIKIRIKVGVAGYVSNVVHSVIHLHVMCNFCVTLFSTAMQRLR